MENRESTARQYAFGDQAVAFGWSQERVLTIDAMPTWLSVTSATRRSKPLRPSVVLANRLISKPSMRRGRDNKAQRGELYHAVPFGYVILPTGKVDFDPDAQARGVVQLLFEKFEDIGSIYGLFHWLIRNDIRLPIRPQTGAKKGQLDWRRPSIPTLAQTLRHPIYAGAYTDGRRPTDPKGKFSSGKRYRPWVPMEQWKVLIKDHLPAYISWDQYLKNRERIKQNQNRPDSRGAPRSGAALLPGVLICGNCGRHMQASYHRDGMGHYACNRQYVEATEPRCYGLAAKALDDLVAQQVLRALEAAALDLSLKARGDVERERKRLEKHWQQRRQRARYEVELAERRYQAVDPENRLVAASLEKRWEEALNEERQLQEEFDRFARDTPLELTEEEEARIAHALRR